MQSSQTQDPEEIPPTRHLKICTRLLALLPPYEELHRELAASGFWWKSWREKTFGPAKGAVSLAEFASETYFSGNFLQIALLVLAYARTVEIDASRYLKAVDRLIISRDEYASGLEGLECIILQAKCHLDFGQPRRAWLTYRRGIMLAQLTVGASFESLYTRAKLSRISTAPMHFLQNVPLYGGRCIMATASVASCSGFPIALMIRPWLLFILAYLARRKHPQPRIS
jgi:hypothetical protein